MKKIVISCIVQLLIGVPLFGEDKPPRSADFSLSLNQASYNNAWTGGEAGSINWAANLNLKNEFQIGSTWKLTQRVKLSFGQTHLQNKDTKKWAKPEKSTDRIYLESVARASLQGMFDPYAALVFESQFYDANIKRKLNPITLSESAGISRQFIAKENSQFLSRLGFAVRQRVEYIWYYREMDMVGGYAYETTTDGGIEVVTDFDHEFKKDGLKYNSKLRLFKALFNSKKDEFVGMINADYWQTIDVAWEQTLTARVIKYIQVTLFTELLYDKEIDLASRFRQTLGLGLTVRIL